jgi:dCTP deaminase
MLSNVDIRAAVLNRSLKIEPWTPELLNPCSYDLTLSNKFRTLTRHSGKLDLCEFEEEYATRLIEVHKMTLMPGQCMLAVTQEKISLGPSLAGEVSGKSSLGRLFQAVHVTAGFIDAGFSGYITMEIVNLSPRPVVYTAGQRIGQIIFTKLDTPANPCYDATGQYLNDLCVPIPAKRIKKG